MHPLLDLVSLLRPTATLWGKIEAHGLWSLSFPSREDLIFFWVDEGSCLLLRQEHEPIRLATNDLVLVRTKVPIVIASDLETEAIDSWQLIASTRSRIMRVGQGDGGAVTVRGGRFVFGSENEKLLMNFLPEIVHKASTDTSSEHLRALLVLNEREAATVREEKQFVVGRLIELLLVECLKGLAVSTDANETGLLAGLKDAHLSRVLVALHGNLGRSWTIGQLAKISQTSRSAFNSRFAATVGMSPMTYLQSWRMAVAKEELRKGGRSIAEIADLVGFQSGNAFSSSFARREGCSPSQFMESLNQRGGPDSDDAQKNASEPPLRELSYVKRLNKRAPRHLASKTQPNA